MIPRTMKDPAAIQQFVSAGNAVFTIKSLRTGKHFTFRLRAVPDKEETWFASVLGDQTKFIYFGLLERRDELFRLRVTSNSFTAASPSCRALGFFAAQTLNRKVVPAELEVRHEGRCGCCGRELTVPESIDRGIGPDCWARMRCEGMLESFV